MYKKTETKTSNAKKGEKNGRKKKTERKNVENDIM
jgi:hypothetical protein